MTFAMKNRCYIYKRAERDSAEVVSLIVSGFPWSQAAEILISHGFERP